MAAKHYIPNIISLVATFVNLVNLYQILVFQDFSWFLALLNLSLILDLLDGYLARKLGATSRFGAVLDSFNDVWIYFILPFTYLFLQFIKYSGFSLGLTLACFGLILFAGIFRLVRFTKKGFTQNKHRNYYTGLPVYFNLLIIPIFIKFYEPMLMILFTLVIGLLMPSKILIRKWNPLHSVVVLVIWNFICIGIYLWK